MRKRRLIPLLVAVVIAGTAGAYVPATDLAVAPVQPLAIPKSVTEFDRLLHNLDSREKKLKGELAAIHPKLEMVGHRMLARGRAYYRLIRAGLLPVGGGFDALVDHASRVERMRASLQHDIATKAALEERGGQLRTALKNVRTQRAPLDVHRDAMKQAKAAMRMADERRDAFNRAFGSNGSTDPRGITIYGPDGPFE
ncbi:hypothetical protein JYT22_01320, partial [Endomicrobium sp. AH-315-J14]|nr:hypothetical protein [Endomicrobium sp. AH-315-J14]